MRSDTTQGPAGPLRPRLHVLRQCIRVFLSALFLFSGVTKLRDPQFFAFALKAFKLGVSDAVIVKGAFAVPWMEILGALALLHSRWLRSGALLLLLLLMTFLAGILSLLVRGLEVDCPCFGSLEILCSGPLGICHLARNIVLAMLTAALVIRRSDPQLG